MYIFIILIWIFSVLFRIFGDPLIYSFYGYNSQIIGSSSFEYEKAFKETFSARNFVYVFMFLATLVCFFYSLATAIFKIHLKFYLNYIVLLLSFLFLLLLGVAALIPRPNICC